MTLSDVKTALLTVTPNVGHYKVTKKTDKYIVWAEDSGAAALWADGQQQGQAISGTIDYFTKTEYDPNVQAIEAALNAAKISFKLESVQHEEETGYIHYEWIFEVEGW